MKRAIDRLLTDRWFLPATLVLAAALRLANIAWLHGAPFTDDLQLDHRYYDEWAQRIASGEWSGGDGAFWADPLYAYFLAGLYAVFGRHFMLVRLVQALLGVATCYLTAILGRRVSGSVAIGNLSALVIALFIPAIYYDATFEKTTLCLLLFTTALVGYFGKTWRSALLSGVAVGLAVLTRGNLLLLVVLGGAALAVPTPQELRVGVPRVRIVRAIAFLAGAFAIVSISAARNAAVSGELIPTTANLGQNLYIGQVCARPDGSYDCGFVRPDSRFEEGDFRAEAERRLKRTLTATEVSAYWREQAVAAMAAAPGAVLARAWRKLRLFVHEYENSDNISIEVQAESSPLLRAPFLWMGQLIPLAMLGVFVGWPRGPAYRVLACTVFVYCLGLMPFMVFSRYRATVIPCIAVLAAAAALWLVQAVDARAWRKLALAAAVVVPVAIFSLTWPDWLRQAHDKSVAVSLHNLGENYLAAGKEEDAIHAYERAVATRPEVVVGSLRRLGDLYLARKDYVRAEHYMTRVLELKPTSAMGQRARVQLYTDMLADARYRDDPTVKEKLMRARAGSSVQAPSGGQPAGATIDPRVREEMLARLRPELSGAPVWLQFDDSNQASRELASALRALFESAGWNVRAQVPLAFRVKAGVFLYAADPDPPGYVQAVHDALVAGGFKPAYGTAYREYYAQRIAQDPGYRGFPLADDQTYVLIIGPNPGLAQP